MLDVDGSNTCILAQHPRSLHLKPPGDGNKMVGLSDTLMFFFNVQATGKNSGKLARDWVSLPQRMLAGLSMCVFTLKHSCLSVRSGD